MPTQTPNAAGYADRLKFVDYLFMNTLKLAPLKVEPIAYDNDCPFPYNNYVFVVETESQITSENNHGSMPGTVEIPSDHRKFVLWLSNLASSLNNKVRIENEVAALMLARQARDESIVPRVFAWGSASQGQQGWMVEEFMPGSYLSLDFPEMEIDDQKKILYQMADILQRFQQYKLPSSIQGYGGLTFDSTGQVTVGPMSITDIGPFDTYDELILATIKSKIAEADGNKVIVGWTNNDMNIRARLDKFLDEGFEGMMKEIVERTPKLVHGDFSTDNLLYDPYTMQITAVIDFDFSHIGTVVDEFCRSLEHGIGRFPDQRQGKETLPLTKSMLTEFPQPLPESNEDIQWEQAKVWDDALHERNMYRPGNIQGMEAASSFYWLSSQLLPFRLSWDFIIESSAKEHVQSWKESGEKLLDEFLTQQGF